jgi:hypothetical protein
MRVKEEDGQDSAETNSWIYCSSVVAIHLRKHGVGRYDGLLFL